MLKLIKANLCLSLNWLQSLSCFPHDVTTRCHGAELGPVYRDLSRFNSLTVVTFVLKL